MDKRADNQQPLHQLLKERWSPRAFSDRPVSADDLRSLMESARWAPSSGNAQPWFFIVAQKQNAAEFEKALACLNPRNASWAKEAAVLIFAVARTKHENQDKPNRHYAYDLVNPSHSSPSKQLPSAFTSTKWPASLLKKSATLTTFPRTSKF